MLCAALLFGWLLLLLPWPSSSVMARSLRRASFLARPLDIFTKSSDPAGLVSAVVRESAPSWLVVADASSTVPALSRGRPFLPRPPFAPAPRTGLTDSGTHWCPPTYHALSARDRIQRDCCPCCQPRVGDCAYRVKPCLRLVCAVFSNLWFSSGLTKRYITVQVHA